MSLKGERVFGIEIVSPEVLEDQNDPIVIINAYPVLEIRKQLLRKGIKRIYHVPRIGSRIAGHDWMDGRLFADNLSKIKLVYDILDDDLSRRIFLNRVLVSRDGDFAHYNSSVEGLCYYGEGGEINMDDIYFRSDIIPLSNNMVYVDVGTFDGDSTESFIKNRSGKFHHILCFEPDTINYEKTKTKFQSYNNIDMFNYGLSDKDEVGYLEGVGTEGAKMVKHIQEKGVNFQQINNRTLDSLNLQEVTLIKMDIEGYEMNALVGMKETLKRCCPSLAICLYHRPEHLWEIPLMLKQINHDYKIKLRQYSKSITEIICYAVMSVV